MAVLALAPVAAQTEAPKTVEPAPLSELIAKVEIPYESFTLDNGLEVLVHEDRTAPMVAVGVWYDVGSKHEPEGKTGFAHLFEHIMGYGTENIPGGENLLLDAAGATGDNASTWFDRTNYYVTVPTGALDLALFAKSDQMGYLLGGVTQETLTNQIGVVQNEKRNGLNNPGGALEFEVLERLYPRGHPYRHDTIGSMADLDAASLETVKQWFRDHYAPNNAVLVLVGDIDVETAKEKAQTWFGAIPPGPEAPDVNAPVPTLDAPQRFTQTTPVPVTVIRKYWAVPGSKEQDSLALDLFGQVLGGLASSRLDNALVRGSEVAVAVSAGNLSFVDAGLFIVEAMVKPGVDPAVVEQALDAELARLMEEGPSEDELQRAKTGTVGSLIRTLDGLSGGGGRAGLLAQGELYFGNPEHYRRELAAYVALDPEAVRLAGQRWLSRPDLTAILEPGAPDFSEDPGGKAGGVAQEYLVPQAIPAGLSATTAGAPDRATPPPVAEVQGFDYPEIQRATLSNGMRVLLLSMTDVPVVSVQVSFDAGYAADPRDALGTQSLMISLMDEGTVNYDPTEFAIAQERLGAAIGGNTEWDQTTFGLNALSANLAPSLSLLAEYIREPAMDPASLERVRARQLTAIRGEIEDPNELIKRVLYPVVYGPDHPYGIPPSGLGEESAVARLTTDDLRTFHGKWLRPDIATIYAVGDTTLAELTAELEASFGSWKAPATPAPAKEYEVAIPEPRQRIVLVDTPGAPQTIIRGVRVLDRKGTDDLVALEAANDAFGNGSLSRMFQEIRQARGWSYSPASFLTQTRDRPLFIMHAPVQNDRAGETVALMRQLLTDFNGARPITAEETERVIESSRRSLPALISSNGALLNTLIEIDQFDRPDDYFETLAGTYAGLDRTILAGAAAQELREPELVFFVVGDRQVIEQQLKTLDLPLEYFNTDTNVSN
ncbi:MAG TPA: pitrilysin family protein [Sphingomonadaceae bacterium]|nr:pitrilysin family protein [Sphingomonadaceae bacterium]